MAYDEINYSSKGPVGYLTLNNPSKINALSKLMIGEIIHALGVIAADEALKVLVIRADGFCQTNHDHEPGCTRCSGRD